MATSLLWMSCSLFPGPIFRLGDRGATAPPVQVMGKAVDLHLLRRIAAPGTPSSGSAKISQKKVS
jgi:hypothetical protein